MTTIIETWQDLFKRYSECDKDIQQGMARMLKSGSWGARVQGKSVSMKIIDEAAAAFPKHKRGKGSMKFTGRWVRITDKYSISGITAWEEGVYPLLAAKRPAHTSRRRRKRHTENKHRRKLFIKDSDGDLHWIGSLRNGKIRLFKINYATLELVQ